MTVTKLAQRGYNILLDSSFVEKSVCASLDQINENLEYDQKCTLILGSTGVIGSQVVTKIVESVVDPEKVSSNFSTTLILLKRKDTFLSKSLYSLNEYNIGFEEVSRIDLDLQLNHPVTVVNSCFKSKIEGCLKSVSVNEIICPDSSQWSKVLTLWKNDSNKMGLPHYNSLTGLVSCLGTTKSQLKSIKSDTKAKKTSQRDVDYSLNFALIKAVTNESIKIVLLTSFNSYTLGNSVPYFKNKLDLEKDISSKLEFKRIFVLRPGPYVLCDSNSEIFSKYILNATLDCRSFMSQIIAYNFYKTQLSKFFGYCVQAANVAKAIELCLFTPDEYETSSNVVYIQSKNMA